jgi:hypothetical protein
MRVTIRRGSGRTSQPSRPDRKRNLSTTSTAKATAPRVKQTGQCPNCGNSLTLDVTPNPLGGWWVGCHSCEAEGVTSGDLLRALAAAVGAPGGGDIKADPVRWLGPYLRAVTTSGYIADLPSDTVIAGWHSALQSADAALAYLDGRGLTDDTVRERRLGYDSVADAIVLPVYLATELVNVRKRFLSPERGQPKYKGLAGRSGQLYPSPPSGHAVLLCAGEFDALLATQEGIPAVTSTTGVGGWRDDWDAYFAGLLVAVCFDVGEESVMDARVAALTEGGACAWPVRLSELGLPRGGDVSAALTRWLHREGPQRPHQQRVPEGNMSPPPQATVLVHMASASYDFVVDERGQPHAVPKRGPRIAIPLSGKGALSKQLTLAYFEANGKPPSTNALVGAIQVLSARAETAKRTTVHLRSARQADGTLVIDMGDPEGRSLVIKDGGWKILKRVPEGVVFRRTTLTSAMPRPVRGGNLNLLRTLINVSDEGWDMLRAWLVMALLPDIPVPILSLTGTQGSGKTSLARAVVGLVDPSPSPLRTPPRVADDWHTVAAASRVVGLDNLSSIHGWFSDLLCRTVTGDGAAKRQLYTDDEIHVTNFRRAIVLTSIDPGGLRGDLGERLMPIELDVISSVRRRTEDELNEQLAHDMPRILGGLLDLVAHVLANPVEVAELPRMGDAGHIMAAVDAALGSHALNAYNGAQDSIAGIVLEGDPVAAAVVQLLREQAEPVWVGTPTDLFGLLSGKTLERRQWPGNPRALSSRLKRLTPAFRDAYGLEVTFERGNGRRVRLRYRPDARPQVKSRARVKRAAGEAR